MRCFKIRERLVTDYRDGELGKREIAQIEEHLRGCKTCRKFFEEVTRFATLPQPAQGIGRKPDTRVWENIDQRISQTQGEVRGVQGMLDFVAVFLKPAPVLKTAFAFSLIVMIGVMIHFPVRMSAPIDLEVSEYLSEQMEMMAILGSGDSEQLSSDGETLIFETDFFDWA